MPLDDLMKWAVKRERTRENNGLIHLGNLLQIGPGWVNFRADVNKKKLHQLHLYKRKKNDANIKKTQNEKGEVKSLNQT